MKDKNFIGKLQGKNNPALAFISQQEAKPEEAQEPIQEMAAPEQTDNKQQTEEKPKVTPEPANNPPMKRLYVETKSKRVQLLMQPTLHKRLKRLANDNELSFNEFIHSTLEAFADEEEKRGL